MRRVEPRQLTFVFADSPEGGKGSRKRDESRGRPYLLHIAKAMTATSSTTTESASQQPSRDDACLSQPLVSGTTVFLVRCVAALTRCATGLGSTFSV